MGPVLAFTGNLKDAESRATPRQRVLTRAVLRHSGSGDLHFGVIKDVSSTGLRVATDLVFSIGTRIEIQLPNIGWIEAEIIHTDGSKFVGLRLDRVIDPQVVKVAISGGYKTPPALPVTVLRPV